MEKVITLMIVLPLLFASCTSTEVADTTTTSNPKDIAESFLQALSSGDIDTCLNLISDDVVFSQPDINLEGKNEFEAVLREMIAWHRQLHLISPFSVDGDKVVCSVRTTGDDCLIMGIDHLNANMEFVIRDDKIHSIISIPNSKE
jgi:ketosteroid isomerase-like protein